MVVLNSQAGHQAGLARGAVECARKGPVSGRLAGKAHPQNRRQFSPDLHDEGEAAVWREHTASPAEKSVRRP